MYVKFDILAINIAMQVLLADYCSLTRSLCTLSVSDQKYPVNLNSTNLEHFSDAIGMRSDF